MFLKWYNVNDKFTDINELPLSKYSGGTLIMYIWNELGFYNVFIISWRSYSYMFLLSFLNKKKKKKKEENLQFSLNQSGHKPSSHVQIR